MTQYKIVYKVNGIEFFRNISYASSAFEAGKMTELSAKWNDKDCDFQIISVEEVDTESKNMEIQSYNIRCIYYVTKGGYYAFKKMF